MHFICALTHLYKQLAILFNRLVKPGAVGLRIMQEAHIDSGGTA